MRVRGEGSRLRAAGERTFDRVRLRSVRVRVRVHGGCGRWRDAMRARGEMRAAREKAGPRGLSFKEKRRHSAADLIQKLTAKPNGVSANQRRGAMWPFGNVSQNS